MSSSERFPNDSITERRFRLYSGSTTKNYSKFILIFPYTFKRQSCSTGIPSPFFVTIKLFLLSQNPSLSSQADVSLGKRSQLLLISCQRGCLEGVLGGFFVTLKLLSVFFSWMSSDDSLVTLVFKIVDLSTEVMEFFLLW